MIDTRRPFTRAMALEAGLDPRLLRGSRFRRIFRSVYVRAEVVDTPRLRAEAALTLFPEPSRASHASAARTYGVPMPALPDEHVTVTCAEDRRRRPEIRVHVSPDPAHRVVRGVRVSEPATMFVELAELLDLVDLVVVGDNLVRVGLAEIEDLVAAADRARGRGAGLARRAAGLVRDRVDSPMETRLRLLLVLAGLPEPQVNLAIRDETGRVLRRFDLCWPASRVVVEYDGRHHVDRQARWERDIDRRHAIERDGWRVIIVTSGGIYRDPVGTVGLVFDALRQRGEPGLPSGAASAWRPHFVA